MRRVGFIDLHDKWDTKEEDLTIYIFGSHARGLELEKTIKHIPATASDLKSEGIGEFYLSIPLNLLNFRIVKLPFSDKEKLKKVIPFELDGLILGGSNSIVFDTIKLNGEDVLVTYIEKGKLTDILTKLALLDLDPRVVTSIELHYAINKGIIDIIPYLVNPEKLTVDDRISAARGELLSNSINLRTGPLAYTRDVGVYKKTLNVSAALSILLAFVIISNLVFRLIIERRDVSSIKKETRGIYVGLFPEDKKITDELYQMKSHIKDIKDRGDVLAGIYPLHFMADLSRRMIHGVVFNEINLDKDLITIKGEAASMDAIGKTKTMLSEFLTDAVVSDIKPSAEGKMLFTVVAKTIKKNDG